MNVSKSALRKKYIVITSHNEVRLDVGTKWTFRLHGISSYQSAIVTSKYLASALHHIITKDGDASSKKLDRIRHVVDTLTTQHEDKPLTSSYILSELVSVLS